MKKNIVVKIFAVVFSMAILAGGAVMATNGYKTIDIFYNNIKIMIDGAEYVPTDANGNVVEPFAYNGTTYLPVRAVANAFGKDVKWDGENAIVYLGKEGRMEPDNSLDKVQYTDYRESNPDNWLERINGTITDYNGYIYTNGYIFCVHGGYKEDHNIIVEFPLNGQYSILKGKIVLPKTINTTTRVENDCHVDDADITIIDENGDIIYTANGITASMPFDFEIDIKGVNKIIITMRTGRGYDTAYAALTDLALYK